MAYYNIVKKEPKKARAHGFDLISFSSFDILTADDVHVAVAHAKKGRIIYLKAYKPDMGLIRKLKEKESCLLFDLADILIAKPGSERQKLMFSMSQSLKLCVKYGVPYIFSFVTDADDKLRMRTLKEAVAIGSLLGLTEPQVKLGFRNVEKLLKAKEAEAED